VLVEVPVEVTLPVSPLLQDAAMTAASTGAIMAANRPALRVPLDMTSVPLITKESMR
jgi:hypothetical protein